MTITRVGNYRIGKQIGEGGFGKVYEAEHIVLKERACIKRNGTESEDHVAILWSEAKLLWKLHEYHSIPCVRDFFKIDDVNAAMVMSFIEGRTLEDLVKDAVSRGKALHPEDACWITERLLGALYYAHCNGVIHSDVKPENVFVEPDKRDIKLIDFGLALYKPTKNTSPNGFSPKYAAPELMLGKPPIPETDIYGAGIVLTRALGADVTRGDFVKGTPRELIEFASKLTRYNPLDRPNWNKENPLEELSELRQKLFGRRHLGSNTRGGK